MAINYNMIVTKNMSYSGTKNINKEQKIIIILVTYFKILRFLRF